MVVVSLPSTLIVVYNQGFTLCPFAMEVFDISFIHFSVVMHFSVYIG